MLYTKSGVLTSNQSLGIQSVTGLGFKPKVLLIQCTKQDTNDGGQNVGFGYSHPPAMFSMAIIDENLNHRLVGHNKAAYTYAKGTNPGVETIRSYTDNANAVHICNDPPLTTDNFTADISSLDADGFSLHTSVIPDNAARVGYLALGGDSIKNDKVGTFISAGVGDQAITGLGFKPTLILLFSMLLPSDNTSVYSSYSHCFGMGNVLNQFAYSSASQKLSTMSVYDAMSADNGYIFMGISDMDSNPAPTYLARLLSFDTDGFTIHWDTHAGGFIAVMYLALAGAFVTDIGSWAIPVTSAIKSFNTKCTPQMVFCANPVCSAFSHTAYDTNNARVGYGWGCKTENTTPRTFVGSACSGDYWTFGPHFTGMAARNNSSYHYNDDTGGYRPFTVYPAGMFGTPYIGVQVQNMRAQSFELYHSNMLGDSGNIGWLAMGDSAGSFGFMT